MYKYYYEKIYVKEDKYIMIILELFEWLIKKKNAQDKTCF